jgi:hypothetical protein
LVQCDAASAGQSDTQFAAGRKARAAESSLRLKQAHLIEFKRKIEGIASIQGESRCVSHLYMRC